MNNSSFASCKEIKKYKKLSRPKGRWEVKDNSLLLFKILYYKGFLKTFSNVFISFIFFNFFIFCQLTPDNSY